MFVCFKRGGIVRKEEVTADARFTRINSARKGKNREQDRVSGKIFVLWLEKGFTLPEGCAKVLRTVPPALCSAELHRPGAQSRGEEFGKVEYHYAS